MGKDDNCGLDVGWLIRNRCCDGGTESTSKKQSKHSKQSKNCKQSKSSTGSIAAVASELESIRGGTPSPKSSTVRISDLDAKNPDVKTHIEVIGPNRIVKQRRNSSVDPEAHFDMSKANGLDFTVGHQHQMPQKGFSASSDSAPLRRTQSASLPDAHKRKSGFFKNLFRRKNPVSVTEDTSPASDSPKLKPVNSNGSSNSTVRVDTSTSNGSFSNVNGGRTRSKSVSSALLRNAKKDRMAHDASSDALRVDTKFDPQPAGDERGIPIERVQTESQASNRDLDPRLEEFIRYYKEHGCNDFSQQENRAGVETVAKKQKPTFSLDSTLVDVNDNEKAHVDKRGRCIPPHPPRSRLPPAIKIKHESAPSSPLQDPNHTPLSGASKFGSFLKRVTSHTDDSFVSNAKPSSASSSVSLLRDADDSSIESFEGGINTSVVPGLENIKPLKRVAFSANTYFNDPPQQICSRNPRKGEVEVKPDGSVVIHRLTPEEKREILEKSSCGIVVGGTGQLKLMNQGEATTTPDKNEGIVLRQHADDSHASQRRHIELAAAEAAAEARAKDAPLDLQRTVSNNEEEVGVNNNLEKVTIDKPMTSRKKGSSASLASMISSDSALLPSDDETDVLPPRNIKIPHDVVYTRCCHLREILPIPATMKQLRKGSTDPIPFLQLRNPKPSKVEVLSFSDFLSIAPVLCLSLDGISLSVEMLRILLSAITYKEKFEKLSLRNTPIDHEGWKVLSYFVSKCKSLTSLDVTMVPGLALNVQKPSKSSNNSTVTRMTCNMENRSDMNWSLLSAAVAASGGLEEMIVSGAHMNQLQLQNFIDIAWTKTLRLGLAYNNLSFEQCESLAKWMSNSKIQGVDIGYNDLSGKITPFIAAVMEKTKKGKNVFKFLSLNSTNLSVPKGAKSENNDVLNMLNILCYCDNLKFLDLSNNPGLFPYGMRSIISVLPVFVSLLRLHLDYNNLSTTAVMQLAEVLPMCQRLNYISLLGIDLNIISASALAAAVKNSKTIITMDIDFTHIPDRIKEKISVYSMRNTQNELEQINKSGSGNGHEKLKSLQEELGRLLTEDSSSRRDYDTLVSNFFERIQSVRAKLQAATEELFKLRLDGELSTEGKETLIKFCFIDASFEKGLKLLAKKSSRNPGSHSKNTSFHPSNAQISKNVDNSPLSNPAAAADISYPRKFNTLVSSSKYASSGHTALLPYHQPSVISYEPADDEVEITYATGDVQNEAKQQLREEGDVLRKSRGVMNQLQDTADKRGQELNTDVLRKVGDKYDSEGIKNFLLKQDISTVVSLLDQMNENDITVDDIFKKRCDGKKPSTPGSSSDQKTSTAVGVESNIQDNKNGGYSDSDQNSNEEEQEEEQMDRAFDEVLDTLARTRNSVQPSDNSPKST
ncbi:unnamed protein product [Kluyveromyces dobzhanskii CBS 2104]|uniref:WGS project CCBQ000000000 data, contig 00014 n=1 Tax=Kluyveromyces dobzhanskii CBS 2104 TaxID=1427455 RepID=A0A0A8L925_9SACH|nr:unnamed protein product [Kluyveromyces dobzhanskii CBS 2104]